MPRTMASVAVENCGDKVERPSDNMVHFVRPPTLRWLLRYSFRALSLVAFAIVLDSPQFGARLASIDPVFVIGGRQVRRRACIGYPR
jgi:hypothetical protein